MKEIQWQNTFWNSLVRMCVVFVSPPPGCAWCSNKLMNSLQKLYVTCWIESFIDERFSISKIQEGYRVGAWRDPKTSNSDKSTMVDEIASCNHIRLALTAWFALQSNERAERTSFRENRSWFAACTFNKEYADQLQWFAFSSIEIKIEIVSVKTSRAE